MTRRYMTACPDCGGRKLQIVCSQLIDVRFRGSGEDEIHDVEDGPYGDMEFGDASPATCDNWVRGSPCGWSGTLSQAKRRV